MKTKWFVLSLLALATSGSVLAKEAAVPSAEARPVISSSAVHVMAQRPRVDVVFVLDTTGSMGGLIQAAKEKIWSIATTLAQAQPAPEIRMGLVAYRDRGDAYVTQVVDLSPDLDAVYTRLMGFRAEGGGDEPESVNQALNEAVGQVSWSHNKSAYKVIFLVGDAPPHMDYKDDVDYPCSVNQARSQGIVVNAILAGNSGETRRVWQDIAQSGGGYYAQVAQDGGAVAIASPYDEKLAKLSAELDDTRLYYGSAEERMERERKISTAKEVHDKASVASRARRATFSSTASGKSSLMGEGELVEDIEKGRVELGKLAPEVMPAPLQGLSPEKQKARVEEMAQKRDRLSKEISELAEKRAVFLRDEVKARGGAEESLDQKLYEAIKKQSEEKGMHYKKDAVIY